MSELLCPQHGPYDASYGTCPYCRAEEGGGPLQAPAPLGGDEMPTDVGAGRAAAGGFTDDEATDIGPGRRAGALDIGDVEPTQIGRAAREDVTEIEFVETGPLAIMWVKQGGRRGRIYRISNHAVVGRSDGDMILDDPKVSNPHAKFTIEEGKFVIWDFGSKNGTHVNGKRIKAATPLNENDEVKMGDTVFVFKALEE
ncbi:MAG: FHA domain-containing protein [Anaerolineales bacterium]